MKQSERTRRVLTEHNRTYPDWRIQDVFKCIYQSACGCEHMVSSLDMATDRIREESKTAAADTESMTDVLDGAYSRVHLSCLNGGLHAETLGKLFLASAKEEPNGKADMEDKLSVARKMVEEKALPFSAEAFEKAVEAWKASGYPAVHHSDTFRRMYCPSYRVIANRYVTFLPLFSKIDALLDKGAAVIAVEGGSASGKTTLGDMLKEVYDCTVFHMDDFFLRPEQRTPERYAEIGGNIDRERFLEEVLLPLSRNEPISYRRFECSAGKLSPPIRVIPHKLTVIEGVYSMHPTFAEHYDLSVFLDISSERQKQRILTRNSSPLAERFFNEWIPLETLYFSKMQVKERCDISIPIGE